ncbi:uncharacterized protein LOC143136230 [Alosa pseudoharengus]|uniref:uncharacterized protein LOC143136230 n=1 Tax=Alosa pseudoharengus TaxID=34774 RepID=UPI003F88E75D
MSDFIRRHKPALLKVLSTEATFILQHVDARDIIDHHSYTNLMNILNAEDKIIKLLDTLIRNKNGDGFLQLLVEEEIQEHLPGLKAIMKNQELSRRDSRDGQLPDCTQPGASGSVVNGQDHLSTGRPRERAVEVSGTVTRPVEGAGVDGHSDCQASTGSGGLLEKRQHLNLENCSFARIEELVSNPEKAETLMSELQNKLKDGEMDRIERELRSKKCIKENWCYTTITKIKNNQGLKEFLEPGEQKIFPSIVFDLFENNRGKKETKNKELNESDVSLEDTETTVEMQPGERVNDDLEHTHQASENNLPFPAKDSYLNSNAQDSEHSYLKEEFLMNSGHQSYQTKSEPCMRMQTSEANGEKDEFKPAEKDPLSDSGHESIFDTMNNSYGTLSTKMSSLEGKEGKRVDVSSALKRDRLSAEHQYLADEIPSKVAKHIDATDCDHEAKNSTETNVDKCPCIVEYSLINYANSILHVTQNSYLANTDVMSNQQSENISHTSESVFQTENNLDKDVEMSVEGIIARMEHQSDEIKVSSKQIQSQDSQNIPAKNTRSSALDCDNLEMDTNVQRYREDSDVLHGTTDKSSNMEADGTNDKENLADELPSKVDKHIDAPSSEHETLVNASLCEPTIPKNQGHSTETPQSDTAVELEPSQSSPTDAMKSRLNNDARASDYSHVEEKPFTNSGNQFQSEQNNTSANPGKHVHSSEDNDGESEHEAIEEHCSPDSSHEDNNANSKDVLIKGDRFESNNLHATSKEAQTQANGYPVLQNIETETSKDYDLSLEMVFTGTSDTIYTTTHMRTQAIKTLAAEAKDFDHEAKNTEINVDKCPSVECSLINHTIPIPHVTQNSYSANTDDMSNQNSEKSSHTAVVHTSDSVFQTEDNLDKDVEISESVASEGIIAETKHQPDDIHDSLKQIQSQYSHNMAIPSKNRSLSASDCDNLEIDTNVQRNIEDVLGGSTDKSSKMEVDGTNDKENSEVDDLDPSYKCSRNVYDSVELEESSERVHSDPIHNSETKNSPMENAQKIPLPQPPSVEGSTVSTVNKKGVFKNEKDKQKAKRPHKRKDPNLEKEWKKERLVKWLDTYKREGNTLEDLKNRISWHTKLEHKTFPYIVADQCTIFHVPKTTDRKFIFLTNVDVYKKGGELRKPCYEKLQYQMGVSGISETIVLSPENKTKPVRYDFSFENIAELCRRLVFEVLAPAIVVFKKVQRERELFSDD